MSAVQSLSLTSTVRPIANLISSPMGDEVVIMNLKDGSYYSLDGVGALVWSQLQEGPRSIARLCEAVTAEYEVSAEECAQDLLALVADLLAGQIVELVEG
jgi:hypothetical protein